MRFQKTWRTQSPPYWRELENLHRLASVVIRKDLLMNAPESIPCGELNEARGDAWKGFIAVRMSQEHIPRLGRLKQRGAATLLVHRICRHAYWDLAALEQPERIGESPIHAAHRLLIHRVDRAQRRVHRIHP